MSTIEKKIIVTGGAGFIGSYLCERLVGQQHHVICVDNFSTGKWENISHLLKKKNFSVKGNRNGYLGLGTLRFAKNA